MKIYYRLIIMVAFLAIGRSVYGQLGWTQKANFPGTNRLDCGAFAIGNFGYVGAGYDGSFLNDFYQWNQSTNTWVAKANYPGAGRYSPTSFAINGKGYFAFGTTNWVVQSDIWRYDPVGNTWTQMAVFPGPARYDAPCFVIGNNAYILGGSPGGPPYYQDVWRYNAVTNTWKQLNNLPVAGVDGMVAFAIGNHGYAGAGWDGSSYHQAMWEYDTTNDSWTPIAPIPSRSTGLAGMPRNFVIGSRAYVCSGRDGTGVSIPDGLSYDTVTKAWCHFSFLGKITRAWATAIAINKKGYTALGTDSTGTLSGPYLNSFYEYSPTSTFTVSDTTSCRNDTVHFAGITTFDSTDMPVGWSWTFTGGNPASSTSQYPQVIYSAPGTYTVEAIITSCAGTDTVIRSIHVGAGAVVLKLNGDTSICKGTSTTLKATGGGTYLWSNGATTDSITVNPNSTTTYSVVVHNGPCADSGTIKVNVTNTLAVTITPDKGICRGSMINLVATGGGTYLWSNGATTSSITVSPNSSTIYTVIVSNGACSDTAKTSVVVHQLPAVTVSANQTICSGDSVALDAGGGGTYLWSNGSSTSSITVKPGANTTYTLTVTKDSCSKDTTVTVDVDNKTNGSITKPPKICAGSPVTLTASGGGTYKWSNGATTSSITISPAADTNITVIVSTGCPDTLSALVIVNNPQLNATGDTSIAPGDTAFLSASGKGDTGFVWSPATNLSCTNCPNPVATPSVTTVYTVTGLDSSGCLLQRTVTVIVAKPCNDLYVPNVFTPNNDGINDDFVISVDTLYPTHEHSSWINFTSYAIVIYDRWGKEVYTSTDPNQPWNGRVLNTNYLVPEGVYYYIIKATCGESNYTKKGFVQVLGEK